jgi:glyoxylase-like metal-dependent hydrolase (beta-lactamase superfamily II)
MSQFMAKSGYSPRAFSQLFPPNVVSNFISVIDAPDGLEEEATMRRISVIFVAIFLFVIAVPGFSNEPEVDFRVQRLSERVLVFTEISPWESNHVVIVGAKGLVLVDPGHTALMGRLIREAVASELGRDRFAYVINTHGHWGHTWGNSAFPEATVVGHEQAARTMEADKVNLERRAEFTRGQVAQNEALLAELDGESEEARAAQIQRDHWDRVTRGLEESGFVVQPPGLTFSDRLQLDLGDLTLEMVFLGRGHSQADIAVWIPEEKVLLIGCFFLEQGPLPVFGTQATLDPDRWLEVFGSFLDREVEIEHVVLGQYTIWSHEQLAEMRDYIAFLWPEVTKLAEEGVDFETAIARLPPPQELDFMREDGVSDEDLDRFHRFETTAFWRQHKESAAQRVEQAITEEGAEAGVAAYRLMVENNDTDVFFDEAAFNMLGYRLLGQEKVDEAIAVFEINVDHFPESWNVYDSLGEAFAVKGDTGRAIELYRRSVELNPDNANGVQAIERLEAEDAAAE